MAGLNNLLADVCPVEDDQDQETVPEYPLAPDHWINAPLGKDGDYKTLLHLGIETGYCIILLYPVYKNFYYLR